MTVHETKGKIYNRIKIVNKTPKISAQKENLWLQEKSSSSCRMTSADLPDSLLPPFSIINHSRKVFKTTYCIGMELLYVGSS